MNLIVRPPAYFKILIDFFPNHYQRSANIRNEAIGNLKSFKVKSILLVMQDILFKTKINRLILITF